MAKNYLKMFPNNRYVDGNIKILGQFDTIDSENRVSGKGAKKLKINTWTCDFTTESGWLAAWSRKDSDSLLYEANTTAGLVIFS